MQILRRVTIKGFKSIRDREIELGSLNLLIGPNGAGKSNFVSLFRMLNYMLTEALQLFVGESGGATSLLYLGAKTTPQMEVALEFESGAGESEAWTSCYRLRLAHAAQDSLIFTDEVVTYHKAGYERAQETLLGAGHRETALNSASDSGNKTAGMLKSFLNNCRVYQFHDTSPTAFIRGSASINDNRYLRADGGNLAAYLHLLRENHPQSYRMIVDTIRRVAPEFGDFYLLPLRLKPEKIQIEWREQGSDYLFGPHQLPDGLLRFMALATLCLQPDEYLPAVIVVDEPELGLHPTALAILAGMLKRVSGRCQVIAATQSATLLDHFGPSDVIVVERQRGERQGSETVFRRPDAAGLSEWIEEYTTGELFLKNLLGGHP